VAKHISRNKIGTLPDAINEREENEFKPEKTKSQILHEQYWN